MQKIGDVIYGWPHYVCCKHASCGRKLVCRRGHYWTPILRCRAINYINNRVLHIHSTLWADYVALSLSLSWPDNANDLIQAMSVCLTACYNAITLEPNSCRIRHNLHLLHILSLCTSLSWPDNANSSHVFISNCLLQYYYIGAKFVWNSPEFALIVLP